ncbi:MAG: hypothetical protein KVP17_003331, partial [Porospora cf. gigantea B]
MEEFLNMIVRLHSLKQPYNESIENFVFPMLVPGALLSKRTNIQAQKHCWREELSRWLRQEENVLMKEPFAGGQDCYSNLMSEFMHALHHNFSQSERLNESQFQRVLHYMTPSVRVRGLNPVWRPDPLVAQPCMLRVWAAGDDGTSRFGNESAFWMNGLLKLTGSHVKFLTPIDGGVSTPMHWRQVHGFKIPLQCFQKLEVNHRPSAACPGYETEIVWRKQLEIPVSDNYVLSNMTDEPLDNISTSDSNGKIITYKIALGKTIKPKDAPNHPSQEVTSHGEHFHAYPLSFRVNTFFLQRWEDVLFGCHMNENHRNLDGLHLVLDRSATSSPSSTDSISSSSSNSLLTANISDDSSTSTSLSSRGFSSSAGISVTTSSSSSSSTTTAKMDAADRSPSEKLPSEIPPPPALGQYKGQWRDYRYHGKGTLYDDHGDMVYEGDWRL